MAREKVYLVTVQSPTWRDGHTRPGNQRPGTGSLQQRLTKLACSSHLCCRILALTDLVMFVRILNLLITTCSIASADKNSAW
jgi:hypothetical protein